MSDHNRVIKGLECCLNGPMKCEECPYESDREDVRCAKELRTEATALLRDQEALAPELEVLTTIDRIYKCPKCHKCFFYKKQKYCDQCGQAVKWDD